MPTSVWSKDKPVRAGWYWFYGVFGASEEPFLVPVQVAHSEYGTRYSIGGVLDEVTWFGYWKPLSAPAVCPAWNESDFEEVEEVDDAPAQ